MGRSERKSFILCVSAEKYYADGTDTTHTMPGQQAPLHNHAMLYTSDVLPIISFARHRFQLRHLLRRHRFLLHGSLDVFGRDEPKRE